MQAITKHEYEFYKCASKNDITDQLDTFLTVGADIMLNDTNNQHLCLYNVRVCRFLR